MVRLQLTIMYELNIIITNQTVKQHHKNYYLLFKESKTQL